MQLHSKPGCVASQPFSIGKCWQNRFFPSPQNELSCGKMSSFGLFAYHFHSLVTEKHYWLCFNFILLLSRPSRWSLPLAGAVSACAECWAALRREGVVQGYPLPISPVSTSQRLRCAAVKCCWLATMLSCLCLVTAGDHAGENAAGADATVARVVKG